MRRLHVILVPIVFVLFAASLHAQSNQIVDRLLDQKVASFGDAAYMILSAAGTIAAGCHSGGRGGGGGIGEAVVGPPHGGPADHPG